MTAHSSLGASSSHRWMNCPGSNAFVEKLQEEGKVQKDESSDHAREGTAAHELCEICLDMDKDAWEFIGDEVEGFPVTPEMVESVQMYVDHIRELGGEQFYEVKFHLDHVHESMFGTADAVVWNPSYRLTVGDFKYGKGVWVDPEDNSQLMFYALGAVYHFGLQDSKSDFVVDMTIIQPRCMRGDEPLIRTYSVPKAELLRWEKVLKAAVEATMKPEAPLVCGDWCRWCRAKALCPRRDDEFHAYAVEVFQDIPKELEFPSPVGLTNDQISKLLDAEKAFIGFFTGLREHAQELVEAGQGVPHYVLAPGRKTRSWKDPEKVKEAFKGRKNIYTKQTLKSPAQLEKVVGEDEVAPFVEVTQKQVLKRSKGISLEMAISAFLDKGED